MRESTFIHRSSTSYTLPYTQQVQPASQPNRVEPSRTALSQAIQAHSDTPSEVSSLLFAIITMCVLPPGQCIQHLARVPRRTGFHELIVDRWPFSVYPTRTKPTVFSSFGQDFAVRSCRSRWLLFFFSSLLLLFASIQQSFCVSCSIFFLFSFFSVFFFLIFGILFLLFHRNNNDFCPVR